MYWSCSIKAPLCLIIYIPAISYILQIMNNAIDWDWPLLFWTTINMTISRNCFVWQKVYPYPGLWCVTYRRQLLIPTISILYGDGGGRPSSVISLGVTSVGSLPWASDVPDRCGIFMGRYRPQIPRALGCQRGLALADLGCTVDHLDPTPANLIPPSSFAVSCDLKALWPGVRDVEVWVAGAQHGP